MMRTLIRFGTIAHSRKNGFVVAGRSFRRKLRRKQLHGNESALLSAGMQCNPHAYTGRTLGLSDLPRAKPLKTLALPSGNPDVGRSMTYAIVGHKTVPHNHYAFQ